MTMAMTEILFIYILKYSDKNHETYQTAEVPHFQDKLSSLEFYSISFSSMETGTFSNFHAFSISRKMLWVLEIHRNLYTKYFTTLPPPPSNIWQHIAVYICNTRYLVKVILATPKALT